MTYYNCNLDLFSITCLAHYQHPFYPLLQRVSFPHPPPHLSWVNLLSPKTATPFSVWGLHLLYHRGPPILSRIHPLIGDRHLSRPHRNHPSRSTDNKNNSNAPLSFHNYEWPPSPSPRLSSHWVPAISFQSAATSSWRSTKWPHSILTLWHIYVTSPLNSRCGVPTSFHSTPTRSL